MPHASSGGGDLESDDEIKVFQVEGEGEDEERSSAEHLKEDKSSLVAEIPDREEKSAPVASQPFLPSKTHLPRSDFPGFSGKPFEYLPPTPFGYVVSPYHPHPNGALGPLSMVNRVPMVSSNHMSPSLPLMMYNPEAFQPPPAHMGISPVHIDPKTGMARSPVYPLTSTSQFHPVFSPDFTQQFQWPHSSMYSMASGFRTPPYPGFPMPPTSMPSKFSPSLLPQNPGLSPSLSHHPLLGPKIEMPDSQESRYLCNSLSRHLPSLNHHQSRSSHPATSGGSSSQGAPLNSHSNSPHNHSNVGDSSSRAHAAEKKKTHIKKPLNAFMLYMKEMRSQVVAECTLKESAAINQILGRRWHNLSREEQAKYYEMARKERQLHMQLYPGWTARDNYAINAKRKKRKKDKSQDGDANNLKKCRARYGLDKQSSWCKPCRRKKKCVRYLSSSDNAGESEENIGSVDSMNSEAPTPDSRYGVDSSQLSDGDSGNGDLDDDVEVSSEFSLSSPPVMSLSSPSVPRPSDNVQSSMFSNGRLPVGSPPSQQMHHPLNVQHLSRSSTHQLPDSPEAAIPQLPTPPSTDSSTSTTVGIAVT